MEWFLIDLSETDVVKFCKFGLTLWLFTISSLFSNSNLLMVFVWFYCGTFLSNFLADFWIFSGDWTSSFDFFFFLPFYISCSFLIFSSSIFCFLILYCSKLLFISHLSRKSTFLYSISRFFYRVSRVLKHW